MGKNRHQPRTLAELRRSPKPQSPAELEALSEWYFGVPLHLETLYLFADSASYKVAEKYDSYNGAGWLFSSYSRDGYDYSARFWRHVIGELSSGGIAGHSHGQCEIVAHRHRARLRRFSDFLRRKELGSLRPAFERLAREYGAGESTEIRGIRAPVDGRVDGASRASKS